ncbi:MAG: hypothetical protein ACXWAT_15570 [Methylobacter sp.]
MLRKQNIIKSRLGKPDQGTSQIIPIMADCWRESALPRYSVHVCYQKPNDDQTCAKRLESVAYTQGHKWQRHYWEHLIRDDADYQRHVNYVHVNPLKHWHVNRVVD